MKFSVLTFNLDKGKGLAKLIRIVKKDKPDIVAVQEFDTSPDARKLIEDLGYELADNAFSFRYFLTKYSVSTFYNPKKLTFDRSSKVSLQIGFWDLFLFFRGGRRSVITTYFDMGTKRLCVHNVHLTPYTTNRLRRKQIDKTLKSITPHEDPTIVLGDFNYPYNRGKFEEFFKTYDFKEATEGIFHTFRSSLRFLPFKFKLDYVLYNGLTHIKTRQINTFATDHTPIISTFEL